MGDPAGRTLPTFRATPWGVHRPALAAALAARITLIDLDHRPSGPGCLGADLPAQRHTSQARQVYPGPPGRGVALDLRSALIEREVHALVSSPAPKARGAGPAGTEVLQCPRLIAQHLIERLPRQLGGPVRLRGLAQAGELPRQRHPVQARRTGLIRTRAPCQRPVPHETGGAQEPPQRAPLARAGVAAQAVGSLTGGRLGHERIYHV